MEYHLRSDQQLLAECALDNKKAYTALFERYSGKLYTYALQYVKDDCLAEEAMMDVMLWIWNKRYDLDIQGELKYYLFRAVKNATIKVIRKNAITLSPVADIENDLRFTARPADEYLHSRQLEHQYYASLEQLSPQRKLVFTMSREHDLSHAEIAGDLNLSVNTVKNHVKSALVHFKKEFSNYTPVLYPVFIMLYFL